MKDNSLMISLKVRAHFFGKIIEVMLEVGKQTKCMAEELLLGLMVRSLVDNMKQIRRTVGAN
jgi:hypothetical protein